MDPVSVRVFTSHPVAAAQYARLLASEKDIRLVADEERFQVGVFDSEMRSLEATLTLVRLKCPAMRPLLLSSHCDENECLRWLLRGIWGLVQYERYEEDLPRAVRQAAEGQLWFAGPVVIRWMKIEAARRARALRPPLSKREQEVMELLLRRLSNKEIADILGVSERTVKFHVSNVLHKLHIESRQELPVDLLPFLKPV